MKKGTFTESKAENSPSGGVLVGKRKGQTIIHNKGSLSGYLVGKTHDEGGIKAINKSTGQPLEMQGGEVVITAPAVADQTKREFEGEMLTNREILSKINEKGGGVSFAKGGDIPEKMKCSGASYNYGGKTMTDHEIMIMINNGGHLAKGMTLKDIAEKHDVSISEINEQVKLGLKAESEHTSSKREQMKIVKDHLFENPEYYTLLKEAGLEKGGAIKTWKQKYNKKYGYAENESHDLEEIAKDTGISLKGLQQIYNKGIGAYKTYPESVRPNVKSKEQWAMARVYSAVMGGKASKIDANELKMKRGGQVKEDLVKDSKKGDHPARDLNNYNDLMDVGVDGEVGGETGLELTDGVGGADASGGVGAFDDGGEVGCYANGGATLSAEVFEWDKVPTNYRNISKVKKVPFTNNPMDKGLDSIISPFLGKDELRPVMNGINFDDNGITATNAHILITLPYPNKKYDGVYDVNKAKKTKSDEVLLINEKYPNYEAVIPKSETAGTPYLIDVYKLLQYTKTALNYTNKVTHAIAFKYGEDERIGVNGKFLSQVLTTALKLGHKKIYVFIQTSNRALVLSPNKNYELGNDELLLTMPVMLTSAYETITGYGTSDPDYNRSLKAYFDFNDNEIHNADGSVAEFKMQYENNLSVDDDYLALLTKITRKYYTLPILSYAKVENGKMSATDLDISLIVKDVNMPDGIYEIVNKAPNITMNPIEDFPRERVFNKDEISSKGSADSRINTAFEFVTFSEVFEFYLDKLLLSVGKDDLRPVMSGICIKKTSDNELFLVTTNAHTLCKINITEYCEFEKDDRDLEYILPVKYLKDFVALADGSLHFKCSKANMFIESENLEYIARTIDGNYPNYNAVIPRNNTKKIVFDHVAMNKCLQSKQLKDLIAKYKGQKDILIDFYNIGNTLYVKVSNSAGYNKTGDTIEVVELCNIDFNYQEVETEISLDQSVFLLMPSKDEFKENQYFSFRKEFFEVMLDTITDTEVECYFTEPMRAYIFPIDAIDYKKTLPEEKTKHQPKKVAKAKKEAVNVEKKQIREAIETLLMLAELEENEEQRKEIYEALEIINMLKEESFESGGKISRKLTFEPIRTPLN